MVTSLDNDEVVAGDAVLLGDTSATTDDPDGIFASARLTAEIQLVVKCSYYSSCICIG